MDLFTAIATSPDEDESMYTLGTLISLPDADFHQVRGKTLATIERFAFRCEAQFSNLFNITSPACSQQPGFSCSVPGSVYFVAWLVHHR